MKLIRYTLVASLVACGVHAEALQLPAVEGQDKAATKPASPKTVEDLKKMRIESKENLLKGDPQNALQAVMAMGECMERSVGQKGMQQMEKEGSTMEKQVRELCKAGKETEAKALQAQYAIKFSQSKEYMAMKACADKYKAMMNDPMFANMNKSMGRADASKDDICGSKSEKPKV